LSARAATDTGGVHYGWRAVAVPIVGWIRDRTGTYLPAIGIIFVLTLAAALCISRLRLPRARAHAHSPGMGGLSSV